jgi:hypothetical protein
MKTGTPSYALLLACGLIHCSSHMLSAQALDMDAARAEAGARLLLANYYERLLAYPVCVLGVSGGIRAQPNWEASLLGPLCDPPDACRSTSLDDCMGGETMCRSLSSRCWVRASAADRERLLQDLDEFARSAPDSDWIIGQRVNLALKNAQFARAIAVADSCRATPWWCSLLQGLARHRHTQGSGDAHLEAALADVPLGTSAWSGSPNPAWEDRGVHCEWNDVTPLLEAELLAEYQDLSCDDREAFHDRFWWLTDPLWSVAGNERRSEHIARYVQKSCSRKTSDLGSVSGQCRGRARDGATG